MRTFGRRDLAPVVVPPPQQPAKIPEARPEDAPSAIAVNLRDQVLKQIDPSATVNIAPDVLATQIETIINEIANEQKLEISGQEQVRLARDFANDITGFGPLQALLLDDGVNDIMVNGPNKVYVERNGKVERVAIRFRDDEHIASVAQKIAARVGRRIDESSPMVDARLTDGSRVNIIFPPLSIDGPCISIRKFPSRRFNLASLVANGTMNEGISKLLEIAARCRLNLLISGGTGSGKTTLLNAMSLAIEHSERIVTIEDAAELQLQQPHVIRLETRPPNLEGSGQIGSLSARCGVPKPSICFRP